MSYIDFLEQFSRQMDGSTITHFKIELNLIKILQITIDFNTKGDTRPMT